MTPALALVAALLLAADPAPSRDELKALDRDEAAAEAAADAGDVREALRYFDYFGHEHEAFAAAVLEYGRAQRRLRRAVVGAFGDEAWADAARALGVPRRRGGEGRSVRRDGAVLYVKNPGATHEVPYVRVDGVWKLSLRDVLLTAVRARFGADVAVEESDLHVLAGKMAKVVQARAKSLSDLAESVRARRVRSGEELRKAVEALRR